VQIRLRLGPAGSGKTYRCLAEIRAALNSSAEGPPLLLIAPKQTTYQLERQLLADGTLAGYTRLRILSFERLAKYILEHTQQAAPATLDEEGRLMVLRGFLSRRRDQLKIFRASARLTGFARQLSLILREIQRNQLTPGDLTRVARALKTRDGLAGKLQDLALLLQDYLDWLSAHNLQDNDYLLPTAAAALRSLRAAAPRTDHVWVDGFAEFSEQELDLLSALLPDCEGATLAFCLDASASAGRSWVSTWSMVRQTAERCRKKFAAVPGVEVVIEDLERDPDRNRFAANPVLLHLERHWTEPQPFEPAHFPAGQATLEDSLRVAVCGDREAEATLAAREILRHVRTGGRYREAAVLVRELEGYHQPLQRVFSHYEIPYFLDRRESVAHHPLAELTRSALRTIAFHWQPDDWFAALKTELVPASAAEIDRLENEALARGWEGSAWQKPLGVADEPELTQWLTALQNRILPPFQSLAGALAADRNQPTGPQLASALRELWGILQIEKQLQGWAASEIIQPGNPTPNSVHATVWLQMNKWLRNLELAFPTERLPLREWMPILESGLGNITAGVIPPALDQVLVGAIDRSRNPDLKLAVVLGLNESVFPALPQPPVLLTDADRLELEKHELALGATSRDQLGRERYYGYIACTRARKRLVLSRSQRDHRNATLNPSPFLGVIRQLFPSLPIPTLPQRPAWRDSEHPVELVVPVLKARAQRARDNLRKSGLGEPDTKLTDGIRSEPPIWKQLESMPAIAARLEQLSHLQNPDKEEGLAPELAERLYGPALRTSVSRMEQFAACPFKFFIHSGLRAESRKRFEVDAKEQGTFQHDALALFHEQLCRQGKQWRDLSALEARERIAAIASTLSATFRDGLFEANEESRFTARALTESLQDFVETLVRWMSRQYLFNPVAVELPFGESQGSPAWSLVLGPHHRLELYGRIDRIDLCAEDGIDSALCVVVDYKSSDKQIDPVLVANGQQLQLLAYLSVLRRWPNPRARFGFAKLAPAGVFYVNLRGKYERAPNRSAALSQTEEARKLAYRHTGRFDRRALRQLDARRDAQQGDQFNYRLKKDGDIVKNCHEALSTPEFELLLDSIEENLRQMGRRIYAGAAAVDPFRKGAMLACDQCDYHAVCRIDPWSHHYRVLRKDHSSAVSSDDSVMEPPN
jgi:ATP-dependent helicase/nuclease subunit B